MHLLHFIRKRGYTIETRVIILILQKVKCLKKYAEIN